MSLSRRRNWWAGLALIAVAVGVGWTFAQPTQKEASPPPQSLLPAKAILLYTDDGNAAHQEAWEQTAAYQSLDESGLLDVFRNLIGTLQQTAAQQGAGPIVNTVMALLNDVRAHGMSLAITVEPPQNGPPTGYAIVVLHNAAQHEPTVNMLTQLASQGQIPFQTADHGGREVTSAVIPDSPGVEVGWWKEKGHLVLVVGIDAVNSAIAVAAGEAENATAHPLWAKVEQEREFEVTRSGWLDVAAIRELVSGIRISNPEAPEITVGDAIRLLGLENLNSIVAQGGYKGKALWAETWIDAPAPRKGLLSLSDGEAISLDDLPPLPYGVSTFSASRFSAAGLYDELLRIAREGAAMAPDEQFSQQLEGFLVEARNKLGFDVREDLLESIGSLVVAYNDSKQGILTLGAGFAVELKDPEKFRQTADQLLGVIQEETRGEINIRRVEKHGRELVMLEFRPTPFGYTYCVDGNWLVLGSPQVIEAFLLRQDGKLPKWSPTQAHEEAFAELPKEFAAITVTDPRGAVNFLMGLAPLGVGLLQVGIQESDEFPEGFEFPLRMEDIPPAELISHPLFPNVLVAEVTDEGFHYTSRASLPGLGFMGASDAGTTTAVVAVGAALLLPAIQQARMAARRMESQNNLKQLALAMHNHEATYQSFPAGTIPNKNLNPEERLSWMVSLLPFLEQQALFQQINRELGWMDDQNAQWLQMSVDVYLNPAAAVEDLAIAANDFDDSAWGRTHYVGIAGLGEDGPELPVDDPKAGIFAYDRVTRFRDILDGTSNTVMISEASGDFGPWSAGGRATIRPLTQQPYINGPDGIGGPFPGGCNMALGDGAVRFISQEIDPSVMEALSTIRGGEVIPNF